MTRYAPGPRPDVRIQIHGRNPGYTLQGSAAEWVHFLDDSVIPEDDISFRVRENIRKHPTAAGLVGVSTFPCADSIFTAALHVSGFT